MQLIDVYSDGGRVVGAEWLARAEAVHRQLRPHLPPDYAGTMARVLAAARMVLATDGERVIGLAVYRWYENTFDGLKFYVDDLVTDEAYRSQGVGHVLVAHLEHVAHALGARGVSLDSGTHRTQAHRFYFREGFVIPAFNFKKIFS